MRKITIIFLTLSLLLGTINCHASMEMATHEEMKALAKIGVDEPSYTYEDLEMLAHVINAEGGAATYVCDDMCYFIGSVVLNRVKSDLFPDTIYGVVTQPGQYSSFNSGNWRVPISDRSWEIAQELLDSGSKLPDNYIFQANFTQGSGGFKVQNMWFCYK